MAMREFEQIISNNLIFFYVFTFFLGACFASFFNVYSLRYIKILESENASEVKSWFEELNVKVPEKVNELSTQSINLSYPSSHCYSCKTPLKWYHNIPILSFLFLKGKCGFCNTKISFQYPIVETIGGVILVGVFHLFLIKGDSLELFLIGSLFFMLTFLLLLIDYKTMYLPDNLTYFLLWVGLLLVSLGYNIVPTNINQVIWASISGFMFFFVLGWIGKNLKGQEVIGGGDLKLVAAIAPYVGFKGVAFTIFFSPFLGIFFWLLFKFLNKDEEQFPYGPSLILSSWVFIFYGNDILKIIGII